MTRSRQRPAIISELDYCRYSVRGGKRGSRHGRRRQSRLTQRLVWVKVWRTASVSSRALRLAPVVQGDESLLHHPALSPPQIRRDFPGTSLQLKGAWDATIERRTVSSLLHSSRRLSSNRDATWLACASSGYVSGSAWHASYPVLDSPHTAATSYACLYRHWIVGRGLDWSLVRMIPSFRPPHPSVKIGLGHDSATMTKDEIKDRKSHHRHPSAVVNAHDSPTSTSSTRVPFFLYASQSRTGYIPESYRQFGYLRRNPVVCFDSSIGFSQLVGAIVHPVHRSCQYLSAFMFNSS
ncbi:hypothetical protein EJ04DRAFT_519166 [Polyplosphaeria fusca]|uniref:Uncharacterized protein n=1 Tax=Polyplosphaeria fusca TaxID=682080 RepID=A0A9P4R9W9_9PLEO|nr:hypothetical protein EJ04DRAFT_519166 [Polyplosphaeria fusca]